MNKKKSIKKIYKIIGVAFVFLSFILLIILLHRSMCALLLASPDYQCNLQSLKIVYTPSWAKTQKFKIPILPDFKNDKISIFDKNLTPMVYAAFKKAPWIEKVLAVKKILPNRIEVKLKPRKPIAAVEYNGRYYLVDKYFFRLPGEYKKLNFINFPLPKIVGVKNPPPQNGKKWNNVRVTAGIEIAQTIVKHKIYEKIKIVAIDVRRLYASSNKKQTVDVIIWAENMVPIRWGRVPEKNVFGELPKEKKLHNLKLVLLSCPKLKGLKYVEIRFDKPYIATK